MNTDCMENLRVLAGCNFNSVSEQDLRLLGEKYCLSDEELQELKQYCAEHGIDVYDEVELAGVSDDEYADSPIEEMYRMTDEEKEGRKLASALLKRILQLSEEKSRKNRKVKMCGTYLTHLIESMERLVMRGFSNEQLKYVIAHLTYSDENGFFVRADQQDPEMCDKLNERLTQLISRLRINRLNSDMFDD